MYKARSEVVDESLLLSFTERLGRPVPREEITQQPSHPLAFLLSMVDQPFLLSFLLGADGGFATQTGGSL